MKKIGLSIIVATMLSSCEVYKRYERPTDLDFQLTYRDIPMKERRSSSFGQMSWQKLFKDPYLQSLIEIGLTNNTELRTAHLRIQEAEAVLLNSKVSYLPSIYLSPEGTLSSFDNSKATKTYSLSASASWEIDIFGKLTNAKREAKAEFEGDIAYSQAVRTKLIATIADSYYTLLTLDCQLAISEETLISWEKRIQAMKLLKQAGESNDAAVLQAHANHLALKTTVWNMRQSIHEMENSLSTVLGVYPQHIERGTLDGQEFPDTVTAGIPLQLLADRPDVRQAEHELARAFYATNSARAAFYPSLSLSGSAGWTNNSGTGIINPGAMLLSAIGSLTQPLFNKGTNIANLRVAKAQQEEAKLAFRQVLLDAGQEVNNALTQWQMADHRINLCQQQVETLQEALRKTELLMRYSSTNYLEVLTAQQTLLSAEQTLTQSRVEKIQGVINLYHALGGGSKE